MSYVLLILSSYYQRYGGLLERLKPKPDREATK
jgi:hypothetical protein